MRTIDEFSNIPTSVLTEITDNELFSELSKTPDAVEAEAGKTLFNTPTPNPIESFGEKMASGVKQGESFNLGSIVTGEIAIDIFDTLIPSLLVVSLQKAFEIEAKKQQFQLTKSEKDILSPIMQKCMEQMNVTFDNPFKALAFAGLFIYGAKMVDIYGKNADKINEKFSQPAVEKRKPGRPRKS